MTRRNVKLRGGTLTISGNGRAVWVSDEGPTATVELRYAVDRGGRTSVREVHVSNPRRVEAAVLRHIPLGAIEDALNGVPVVETDQAGAIRPVKSYRIVGRPKTDEDYQRVAQLYTAAAVEIANPARRLADDSGVSPRTVSRWLTEARRRGFLGPTRRAATTSTRRRS